MSGDILKTVALLAERIRPCGERWLVERDEDSVRITLKVSFGRSAWVDLDPALLSAPSHAAAQVVLEEIRNLRRHVELVPAIYDRGEE